MSSLRFVFFLEPGSSKNQWKTKKWRKKTNKPAKRNVKNKSLGAKDFRTREGIKMTAAWQLKWTRGAQRKDWLRLRQEKKTGGSLVLAAGEFAASLAVCGWWEAYVHYVVAWRLIMPRSVRYLLLRNNTVDFCKKESKRMLRVIKIHRSFTASYI